MGGLDRRMAVAGRRLQRAQVDDFDLPAGVANNAGAMPSASAAPLPTTLSRPSIAISIICPSDKPSVIEMDPPCGK
ncbi:hypothetical protein [Bradyrhizobium sp. LCT2]|uniref:hypothetical protein n=1 Tax=Bradyrhizobium sp. LCT2 TaxID=2493093 RepID=UPI001374EF92|nr:hypothetical protein [Bradyrhizobium sp. LCT2]